MCVPEIFTSLVSHAGGMLGDGLAQLASGEPFDVARNMRMASYGLLIGGPSGHMWHKFLDATVLPHAPKSTRAVLSKLAADQLAFAPLANVALFAFIECSKGTPHQTLFVIQVRSGSAHPTAAVCVDGAAEPRSLFAPKEGVSCREWGGVLLVKLGYGTAALHFGCAKP